MNSLNPLTHWLTEMEELCAAATPGPWKRGNAGAVRSSDWEHILAIGTDAHDADLIAALPPETVRALLECVRALEYYAGNFDGRDGTRWIGGRFFEEDKFGRCSSATPDHASQALAALAARMGDAK